jgi:hypothetical protein
MNNALTQSTHNNEITSHTTTKSYGIAAMEMKARMYTKVAFIANEQTRLDF